MLSSLVLAEKPHIQRLKGVAKMLQDMVTQTDDGSGMSRMAFFMTSATQELAEELSDLDDVAIRVYLYQIGEVISWIGHGDNSRLPDQVRPFAEHINPSKTEPEDEPASTYLAIDPATR